jgi:uncharacterized phage-like protein YoqJ
MTEAEKDHIRKLADECVSKLREHVDNVQILLSTVDEGHSIAWQSGYGNWFARIGHAQEFVRINDERERCGVRQEEASEE